MVRHPGIHRYAGRRKVHPRHASNLARTRQLAVCLREILTVLNSNLSLDDILAYIVYQAVSLLEADAVAIYRLNDEHALLSVQAALGLEADYLAEADIPLGQSVTGQATLQRRPVALSQISYLLAGDHGQLDQARRDLIEHLSERYHALLSAPLIIKDQTYGAITLYYQEPRPFSADDIQLAAAFCDQAALAIENARLRSQVEQTAVAAERNRLARDLHDSVTQTLFSASLIADVLPVVLERDAQEGQQALDELRQLTRGALAEMRTLLLELRPDSLLEARLEDLLRQLAEAITGRARLPVRLDVSGTVVLTPAVRIAFYRIAQEALNNVTKHAGATRAELILRGSPGAAGPALVELSVIDNGRGFDPCQAPADHLGLRIMRERAEAIDAHLEIASQPGQGTTIRLTWPTPSSEGQP